jgi:hypothetical protein
MHIRCSLSGIILSSRTIHATAFLVCGQLNTASESDRRSIFVLHHIVGSDKRSILFSYIVKGDSRSIIVLFSHRLGVNHRRILIHG